MAAGVAMPEVAIAKPSIGLVSNTESQSSVRPEDKVCCDLYRIHKRDAETSET